MLDPFEFFCPICRSKLQVAPEARCCPVDGTSYPRIDGIWHFLRPDRAPVLERFRQEYEAVRLAEGRGSADPAYYRALPFADLSGRFAADWRIRARSFQALCRTVLAPLERGQPLDILDLGAGNGWLSFRLAQRGHNVAAVDLSVNPLDGLGAQVHYEARFTPLQAEFDHLPLGEGRFDLAIFNSSFHYAVDYATTLREARRVLKERGLVVILDTPIYHDGESGKQMVEARQALFLNKYGFRSDALASENYLTYDRLGKLGGQVGLAWQTHRPFRGLRWMLRPWFARVRRRREPAEFLLIVGKGRE